MKYDVHRAKDLIFIFFLNSVLNHVILRVEIRDQIMKYSLNTINLKNSIKHKEYKHNLLIVFMVYYTINKSISV